MHYKMKLNFENWLYISIIFFENCDFFFQSLLTHIKRFLERIYDIKIGHGMLIARKWIIGWNKRR